jgi:hypothetical protein
MTKKHYKKIAELFRDLYPLNGIEEILWKSLRIGIADILKEENPNFSYKKFIDATNDSTFKVKK